MNLLSLIKEELDQYITEFTPNSEILSIQQNIKNLNKDNIVLSPKKLGNVTQFNIGFKDPEIDSDFIQMSKGIRPAILIDTTNYNYIQMIEPIPNEFRNLGLGKKLYEKLSDILGFISSNPKDNVSGEDRTIDATRVSDSIKRGSTSHFIEFPNKTIFIISPNINDEQEGEIVDYIKKNGLTIMNAMTNLPSNWIKGLEYLTAKGTY